MFIPTKLNEMKKNILFLLSTLCISTSVAQMPNTDIWLFDMKDEGGKIIKRGNIFLLAAVDLNFIFYMHIC